MQPLTNMTTDALASLRADADARIREQGRLMATTPADTAAHKAMAEGRPGLIAFRNRIDEELWSRGA